MSLRFFGIQCSYGNPLSICFLKVLWWVMLVRHSIKREIKRLELRVAELAQKFDERKNA